MVPSYLRPAPAARGRKHNGQLSLRCLPTPGDTLTVTKTNEMPVFYSQLAAVRNSVGREKRTNGKGRGEGDRAKASKYNNTHLKTANLIITEGKEG